jgi:signal transduction histidine kinase
VGTAQVGGSVQQVQGLNRAAVLALPVALAAVLGLRALDVDPGAVVPRDLHVAVETAIALTMLLAAFLQVGRLRRSREAADAVLVVGLVTLAGASILSWRLQIGTFGSPSWHLAVWELATLNLVAAVSVAAGAVAPARVVTRRQAVLVAAVVGVTLVAALAAVRLDARAGWSLGPTWVADSQGTVIRPGSGVRAMEVAAAIAFASAAVGFLRRWGIRHDPYLLWLGWFATASAASLVSAALSPHYSSEGLYLSGVFRSLAASLLLVGAIGEIRGYWERHALDAVSLERRRLAYDLHDGMAQELAFVASTARALAAELSRRDLLEVARAAERVLDETRSSIDTLVTPGQRALADVLVTVAEHVAGRGGVPVRSWCDETVTVPAEVAQALARIVHEAVTNAIVHGGADRIDLELRSEDRLQLTIRDNGAGFDPEGPIGTAHYGLASMRDRANRLGALLSIRSVPDGGTEVEVTL